MPQCVNCQDTQYIVVGQGKGFWGYLTRRPNISRLRYIDTIQKKAEPVISLPLYSEYLWISNVNFFAGEYMSLRLKYCLLSEPSYFFLSINTPLSILRRLYIYIESLSLQTNFDRETSSTNPTSVLILWISSKFSKKISTKSVSKCWLRSFLIISQATSTE